MGGSAAHTRAKHVIFKDVDTTFSQRKCFILLPHTKHIEGGVAS